MSTDRLTQADKELWRSLAAAPVVAPGTASDLDFAAWLEGRLTEAEAARIEAAIASDPEMRRAALELAEVLGHERLPASPRLEARAKALVGFEVERAPARAGLFDWLFATNRRFVLQRVATLAAAVVISISGFMMGGGLGASFAQERQAGLSRPAAPPSAGDLSEFPFSDGT
ncbi:MAG: hypothetical protein FJX11_18190 [Alphaproteobacteria bacterium]|nr:hypothetical protein [Alphaproteobacteria bacterium]